MAYNPFQADMTSLIPASAFIGILALMIWLLLDPSSVRNVMQATLPPEARSAPPRYPHFAVIVIFVTGIGLFYFLEAKALIHSPRLADGLPLYSAAIAACFFGANAVWACYWPISFQRAYIPQLRRVQTGDLSREAKRTLAL